MNLGLGTAVIGGVIGLAFTLLGVKILVSGRAPASTARAFRSDRDAGWYHLLFGAALVIIVAGASLPGPVPAIASAVIAVALVAVGVVRFRPRRGRSREEPQ
jgi:Flp pilus assembly protein TadB